MSPKDGTRTPVPQWRFSDRCNLSRKLIPFDDHEAARAGRLKRESDAQDFLHARLVARQLADQVFPESAPHQLQSFDDARPAILGRAGMAISWSRSGPLAVSAVQAGGVVGIDIERKIAIELRPMLDMVALPQEAESVLLSGDEAARLDAFYRLWTAKEAVLKCRGQGLRGGAKSVEIPSEFISGAHGDIWLEEGAGHRHLMRLDAGEEACCSLAFSVRTPI